YQFLRLGREGYREVQQNSIDVATYLSSEIAKIGPFELVSKGDTIPVFAWILKDGYTDKWSLYDLADRLRMKGWLVPAYPMADDLSDMVLQRIVVKVGLSRDLATALLSDIKGEVAFLESLQAPLPREANSGSHFHHGSTSDSGRAPAWCPPRADRSAVVHDHASRETENPGMSAVTSTEHPPSRFFVPTVTKQCWGFMIGSSFFALGSAPGL